MDDVLQLQLGDLHLHDMLLPQLTVNWVPSQNRLPNHSLFRIIHGVESHLVMQCHNEFTPQVRLYLLLTFADTPHESIIVALVKVELQHSSLV